MIAGVEIGNVSLDLTTPILGWFLIRQLRLDNLCAKFKDSSFNHSRDMTAGVEIENVSCDPDHVHFIRSFIHSFNNNILKQYSESHAVSLR